MRIFTAVRHAADPQHYYGGLWSGNFHPALKQLGHEVVESRTDLYPASRFMHIPGAFTPQEQAMRGRLTEQIVAEVKAVHRKQPLDVFLSYFYNAHFDPAGFDEIRKLGIPTINFYCNSIYQFELVAEVAATVDYAWHAEKHARAAYLSIGANPVWVQMAADPSVYFPVEDAPRQGKACFVGQRYADRDRWMAALVQANVPVAIYGPGWPEKAARKESGVGPTGQEDEYLGRKLYRAGSAASYIQAAKSNMQTQGIFWGTARTWRQLQHRRKTVRLASLFYPHARGGIPFQEICSVFSSYEVVLNFSNVWQDGRPGSGLIPHVRLRDFEAPMSRTCYLTGYTDEIAEFYELGKEIDTYRTPEELVDKTRFYLAHPGIAERLREAGYRRALKDHTWVSRFQQLFQDTGLAT